MKRFTISVFTEYGTELLAPISLVFTRRHLTIKSLTISNTELKNMYRYTIVLESTGEQVQKLVLQLEKIVEVLKVFYHTDEETIFQEIGLYKLAVSELTSERMQYLLKVYNAQVLTVCAEYLVLEKRGTEEALQELLEQLKPEGLLEFARSGRVAIVKPTIALFN